MIQPFELEIPALFFSVVELFLANAEDQYVEIELCP